jgi:type I restriction enzyme, S subunit
MLGTRYRERHTFQKRRWSEVRTGYTHFADGDVLLARITPSFENGKSGIAHDLPNGLGAGSTEYFVCRPIPGAVLPEYLLAHFKTRRFLSDGEQVMTGAAGQRRVPRQYVLDSKIWLAPLNEQKRIVDKLDRLLARVDLCRERLERVPVILKRFRQAALSAATSGRLTEDLREGLEPSWTRISVENVAEAIFDGPFGSNLKSNDYTETGVRVVRLENIGHLYFNDHRETYISQEKYLALQKHSLNQKDILFSSFLEEEVRVCLFPPNIGLAINKADCFCIRTNSDLCLPEFLAIRLACSSTYMALRELVHGATRPRVNLKQLRQFQFDLPSIEEQHEIVRRTETLFAYAERLEAHYELARDQVEHLTPALLDKAFHGELVPQDPSDEPASVLLQRIRTTQASGTIQRKKPRRRSDMEKNNTTKNSNAEPIDIVQALREAGKELSSNDLLIAAGYSSEAESEMVEDFFVAVREALRKKEIIRTRRRDADWFSLSV